jgi:hypothetical protein
VLPCIVSRMRIHMQVSAAPAAHIRAVVMGIPITASSIKWPFACWGSTTTTRIIQVFQVSGFCRRSRTRRANWQHVGPRVRRIRSQRSNWSLYPTLCARPDSNYLTKCVAIAIVTLPASGFSTSSMPAAGRNTARAHWKPLRRESLALARMRHLPLPLSSGFPIRVSHA